MDMAEVELERIYVIPLRSAKHGPSSKAAPRAIKLIRKFLSRHMKVEDEKIWIDSSVNELIWSRGKYKVPSKIRVRAVRFDDGVVEVSLPEVEFRSFREEIKAAKEAKKPILKKAEEKPEEGAAGEEEAEEEKEKPEEKKEEIAEEVKEEVEEKKAEEVEKQPEAKESKEHEEGEEVEKLAEGEEIKEEKRPEKVEETKKEEK